MTLILISNTLNDETNIELKDLINLTKTNNNMIFLDISYESLANINKNFYLILHESEEHKIINDKVNINDNIYFYNVIYYSNCEQISNCEPDLNNMKYYLNDNITISDLLELIDLNLKYETYKANENNIIEQDVNNLDINQNYIYIIGGCYRLNVMNYITELEHELKLDDLVDIYILNHYTERYIILGLHKKYYKRNLATITDLLHKYEFKLTPGRPVSSKYGPLVFNYSDKYIYTLEYMNPNNYMEYSDEELQIKLREELELIKRKYEE
jgi:hypothetical protein